MIVIVEDDSQVAELMELVLERAGFLTHTIADGKEALDYVNSHEVSLVFADLGVRGLPGDRLCSAIKENEETRDLPFIVVSGDQEALTRAEACGADGVLRKPFDFSELVRLVEAHVEDEKAS